MNRSIILAALILWAVNAFAQSIVSNSQFQITDWQSYTSMVSVRAVAVDGQNRIWAATSGGVFNVEPSTRKITEFRNIDALISLDATTIAYNAAQNDIYVGTFDGTIEIYDIGLSKWTHITDIVSSAQQYPKRKINDILFHDSLAYIATDFGVLIFNTRQHVFLETIDRVGSFQQKTPINKIVIVNDTITVAGYEGVATAPLPQPGKTLRLPDVWKTLIPQATAAQPHFTSMVLAAEGLFVAADSNIYRRKDNSDTLEIVLSSPASFLHFRSLAHDTSGVFFSMEDRIGKINSNMPTVKHPATIAGQAFLQASGGMKSVVMYETAGLALLEDTTLTMITPNTPLSNRVQDIAIDTDGNLWTATANRNTDGQGFACLLHNKWRNFSSTTTPFIGTDFYWRVSATANGNVWLGTYGGGMLQAKVVDDTILFNQFNSDNSPLCGFPNNKNFTLPGDAISDRSGNVWFAHYGNAIPNCTHHIFMQDKGGSFTPFDFPGNPTEVRGYLRIAIDAAGTKWMASPDGYGLVFFNERNTIGNTSDDVWGKLSTADTPLPDNEITALAIDKNGVLWVGTPSNGLGVIFSPSSILSSDVRNSSSRLKQLARKILLLNSQSINDIMVDALNNKWVATNLGVWVLNEDGTEVIGYINKQQYPLLLSDEIKCLATNENDGTVYLGSLEGLNSIKTLSLKPQEEYKLSMYPQPFNPNRDGELVIEGLEAETQIRIITLDGMLVRVIDTRSRRAVWDGRDEQGNLVSNGVYLALAVSQANTRSTVGKIAVLYK